MALDRCQAPGILDQFIDSFFTPALSLPHFSSSFYIQVSADIFSLIVSKGGDLEKILRRCTESLVSHLEARTDRPLKPTTIDSNVLPLHTCCCLIPGLIASKRGIETLQPIAFRLLRSSDDSLSSAALKTLIAPIITHYSSLPDKTGIEAMKDQLMRCCVEMIRQPGVQRRNALSALVQLPPSLGPPQLIATRSDDQSLNQDIPPLTEMEISFWHEMICCLSSRDDSLDRKRSLYILQQMLGHHLLSSSPWAPWMALCGILEEFATHLIKPLWGLQIDKLHPPCASSLPSNEEGQGKLKIGLNGRVEKIKGKAKVVSKGREEEEVPTHRLHQSWACVIWARGLHHPNLLMHRLTMRTFLSRNWDCPHLMSEVPRGFVAHVFLPSLLREDLHYTPSAGDEDYSGSQSFVFDIRQLASSWLSAWFEVKTRAEVREVIECFLSLTITSKDIPRACLLPAWSIFSKALATAHDIDLNPASGEPDGFAARMIFTLRSAKTSLFLPSGQQLKIDLALCLVQAAAVISPLEACSHSSSSPLDLIVDLPSSWISPQGHLNASCR